MIRVISLISKSIFRANMASQKLLSSESAEDIAPNGESPPITSSPRLRNRYLKKVGVANAEIDDESPLLDDVE